MKSVLRNVLAVALALVAGLAFLAGGVLNVRMLSSPAWFTVPGPAAGRGVAPHAG